MYRVSVLELLRKKKKENIVAPSENRQDVESKIVRRENALPKRDS